MSQNITFTFKRNRFYGGVFYAILLVLLLVIQNNHWSKEAFQSDVDQYYSYLPALAIHGDLGFKYPEANRYWLTEMDNGNRIPKMSLGMAITYSPFFFTAYSIQNIFYPDELNTGYEKTYLAMAKIWCVILSVLFFHLCGKIGAQYWRNYWFGLGLAAIFYFGTNVLHYALGVGLFPHFTVSILVLTMIYFVKKVFDAPVIKPNNFLIICFCVGLATAIRPTDVLIGLYPLAYFIFYKGFRTKILGLIKRPIVLLLAILILAFPFFLQMLYWKVIVGQWIFYSYTEEGFYFTNPKIADFLWSYRKGWWVYSPIAFTGIISLLFIKDRVQQIATIIIIFTAVWVYSSWWCWWFGGGFGSRSIMPYSMLLIVPLGHVILKLKHKPFIKLAATMGLILLLIGVNLRNHRNYKKSWLTYDSMTKALFWHLLIENEKPYNFVDLIDEPDYHGMKYHGVEKMHLQNWVFYQNDFKNLDSTNLLMSYHNLDSINHFKIIYYGNPPKSDAQINFKIKKEGDIIFEETKTIIDEWGAYANNKHFTWLQSYLDVSKTADTQIKLSIINRKNELIHVDSLKVEIW